MVRPRSMKAQRETCSNHPSTETNQPARAKSIYRYALARFRKGCIVSLPFQARAIWDLQHVIKQRLDG
jgi:hypothetical protein